MNLPNFTITPNTLTLITTYQCTAACPNCCFACSPMKKERLTYQDLIYSIEKTHTSFPSIKLVVFTGGEPFILDNDLLKAINYATQRKLGTRIVTNAFWAKSYKKAYLTLRKYKNNGLTEINYSTGDEHQEFIPYENIVFAVRAALDLSLSVAVNVETHDTKKFKANILKNDVRLLKYSNNKNFIVTGGLWAFKNSEPTSQTDVLLQKHKTNELRDKACDTLFSNIAISPKKTLFSCCGFFVDKTKYLQFGKLDQDNLADCYFEQYDDLLKLWLFISGPQVVAEFINNHRKDKQIECFGKHPCSICEKIYTDASNLLILNDNYKKIYPQIILKHRINMSIYKKKGDPNEYL